MTEKPLHVRVAEALGDDFGPCDWAFYCDAEGNLVCSECGAAIRTPEAGRHERAIRRYDTDWSATGPLIEKYQVGLEEPENGGMWTAYYRIREDETMHAYGPTVLMAVCNLILALKEAGKL